MMLLCLTLAPRPSQYPLITRNSILVIRDDGMKASGGRALSGRIPKVLGMIFSLERVPGGMYSMKRVQRVYVQVRVWCPKDSDAVIKVGE